MKISWQTHPAINANSINPRTVDTTNLMEQLAAYWQQNASNTWLTREQARLLNNLEAILLSRSGKYHQRQDERSAARYHNRTVFHESAIDVDVEHPFIHHSFELKECDVTLLHELAEQLPDPLSNDIKTIVPNQVAHIDIWLSLIFEIRKYTTRRFLTTM